MAFRTNYRFERRERDRLKQQKKEEKLRRQQERKGGQPDETGTPEADANPDGPGTRRPSRLSRHHPGPGLCLDSRRPGLP